VAAAHDLDLKTVWADAHDLEVEFEFEFEFKSGLGQPPKI
jgi:hypothetical protein